jgi:hypothetical protein
MPLAGGHVAGYRFALLWFGLPVWDTLVATSHDASRLVSLWPALYLLGMFADGPAAVVAWRAGLRPRAGPLLGNQPMPIPAAAGRGGQRPRTSPPRVRAGPRRTTPFIHIIFALAASPPDRLSSEFEPSCVRHGRRTGRLPPRRPACWA